MFDDSPVPGATLAAHARFVGPILALAALGCAASILGSDPSTGLDVAVRRGPIAPVEQPGLDNTAAVPGARVRVRPVGESGRADGSTDDAGVVAFSLAAGIYAVTVIECPGALGLPETDTARVSRGERTSVTLVCDTGIR